MEILDIVLKAISEKKGKDIEVYDTRNISPFMDTMIIAGADNTRQSNAIANNVEDRLREAGYTGDFRIEGNKESRWLLVDLKDIVIHIFVQDERSLYQLERLYSDCPVTRYDL